jgi:hypothetical protein
VSRVRLLGLSVTLALAAVLLLAGAASGTIRRTSGAFYSGPLILTASVAVQTGIADITCKSDASGTLNGAANTGVLTSLSFTACNPNCTRVVNLGAGGSNLTFVKGSVEPTRIRFTEGFSINITCGLLGTCTMSATPGIAATFVDGSTSGTLPHTAVDLDVVLSGSGTAPCGSTPGLTAIYDVTNVTLSHVG